MSIKNNIIAKIKEESKRDNSILFLIGIIKRVIIRKNFQDSITWLISINKKIRAEVTIRKYVPADIRTPELQILLQAHQIPQQEGK